MKRLFHTAHGLPPAMLTFAVAVLGTAWLWPYLGTDVLDFLLPWFAHIEANGPIGAFAQPFSEYAPPYLYLLSATTLLSPLAGPVTLLKLLAVAGTLALVAALRRLLLALGSDAPWRGAALVVLLPTVFLNAALLAQCDAMWAAPCVMALAAAIERRHRAMLLWCGIAIGVKLQAAFLAPFIVALLIRRRVPLRSWPVAALAWAGTLVPAALAGWPVGDLLTIYLRQGDYFEAVALNAPNVWTLAAPLTDLPLTGLAFAAAIGASAAYTAWASSRTFGARALMEVALLAPLLTVGLLPRMHERYFFLADVLALAIAIRWPDRRSVAIALLVQTGSALALFAYLSGIAGFAAFGAVAMIAATVRLARPLLRPAANDDPVMARISLPAAILS